MIPASSLWTARAKAGAGGSSPFIVLFSIVGYARVFTLGVTGEANQYPWISAGNAGSLSMSVSDLDGSSSTGDLGITVLDYNRLLTQDFQNGVNLIGKVCTIQVGFPGVPQSQYITLATMLVDHIDLANQNLCYKFTLRDNSLLMRSFAFETGDTGWPTSQNNPATVQGLPMAILQEAASQSGLPSGNINSAAIAALNAGAYFGIQQRFSVTYPPRAQDFIEQEIMKPLGGYWFWNYLGQLTPYSMLPYSYPAIAMTLDGSVISFDTPPVPTRSEDYTSEVIYKLDGDPNGQNYQTIIVGAYAPAVNLYGITNSRLIQSRGVRSTLGGARIAHLTMQNIFRRYGLKPLTMSIRCFLPAMLLELGDKVAITHPKVPNGFWPAQFRMAGTMGITGTLWEVRGKSVEIDTGITTLELLDVSWQIQNPAWLIAPDGEGTYVPNKSTDYMFYSSPSGSYSNGDAARNLF